MNSGAIIVDKPSDMTSHDVVSVMRRVFATKRVGHTGTLDPKATGVLPVLIGRATKAADMISANDKRYLATLRLGITTDTLDAWGQILEQKPVNVTNEEIEEVLKAFRGDIMQIPPMYSAIKQDGKKLYELARRGIEVERKARSVTIYNLAVTGREGNDIFLDVTCSKGTYIRTLCADIGQALLCGGHMAALRRTRHGRFDITQAYTIEQLKEQENPYDLLIPTDELFDEEKLVLTTRQAQLLQNGVPIYINAKEGRYRVYGPDNTFLSISQTVEIEGRRCLKLVKAFYG